MVVKQAITTLFVDIGGVLLTNGWDTNSRRKACEMFHLNQEQVDLRHNQAFGVFEVGGMTLDDYIRTVFFYKPVPFSVEDFKHFMFSQSQPYPDMVEWMAHLKSRYSFKIVAVSNEGRELADYRFKTFPLATFIDCFVVSSYVKMRKPDRAIYQLALDLAHVTTKEVIYIDDRLALVEMAQQLIGIKGIWHQNLRSTKEQLLKHLER